MFDIIKIKRQEILLKLKTIRINKKRKDMKMIEAIKS